MELVGTFQIGSLRVSAVSDGTLLAPRGPSWFTGIDSTEWMSAIGVNDPQALLPVNYGAFVVEGAGHVTLVDSGLGEVAGTMKGLVGAGTMLTQLRSLGLFPGDVDRIIQTHFHADHCGWLIRSTDDPELTFPAATVYAHRDEVAYWQSPAADKNLTPGYTRTRIEAVARAGKLKEVVGEYRLDGGIEIIPTPGHTPGHVSIMVRSGDECALLLGDVAHHCIHLERHSWLQNYDVDPAASIATRGKISALAASEDAIVTAPHMPILTLVRLERTKSGFRYLPVT